ncbi:TerC/Alx family metal homeostasis membrane protein [Catellatospora coxensis]|uniref:Tellurium resistance protein TerC n=1 Tax=Catellatospora coxensis TaxID=310354 RepID=A0A8J3KX72_9ACTN|nr:TerC/Alx family metal homeostasis membrane protein [Catellatospora coxensis]GIG05034.1 tellurium resistance protein TerC [Catellatospora coxensis]
MLVDTSAAPLSTIGTPWLWAATVLVLLGLLAVDFAITRRPHAVRMREAVGWTVFYLALPVAFGFFVWWRFGGTPAVEFFTGYVVEKSLSVDNLFVFMLLLAAFAVPAQLAQRVLLYGIVGALVLRAVFIAAGAAVLQTGTWAFLLFGGVLLITAAKVLRDAMRGGQHAIDIDKMRSVRLLRRFMPVTDEYHGSRLTVRRAGVRALTPMALVVAAVFMTDVVFAVDSVPAVYGVTEDPYLVFATNAFALLGLRALYFVLHNALSSLRYLNHGLALILAFIGVKLVLHWAHGVWPALPEVPTVLSLAVIIGVLLTVTLASLAANRRDARVLAAAARDDVGSATEAPALRR